MSDNDSVELHQQCPHCGRALDRASQTDLESEEVLCATMPTPGDVTIDMFGCGEWAVFDSDLRLRVPTDDELIFIGLNPGCRAVRTVWVRMNEERRLDAKNDSGKIRKRGAGWPDLR